MYFQKVHPHFEFQTIVSAWYQPGNIIIWARGRLLDWFWPGQGTSLIIGAICTKVHSPYNKTVEPDQGIRQLCPDCSGSPPRANASHLRARWRPVGSGGTPNQNIKVSRFPIESVASRYIRIKSESMIWKHLSVYIYIYIYIYLFFCYIVFCALSWVLHVFYICCM